MLDELKEFLNIPKIPPKIKLYSTFLVNTKSQTQVSSYKSMLRRLSNTKKVSIMEKINQMKKKEEEKKKALMDNLKKNKKMNLHQFLSRMENYEQKRKYNIELKKNEKLKQETSFLRDKPIINTSSLKLYDNLPKEPLYKRTEEIMYEKKKKLENLTIFYTLPKDMQNSKNFKKNRNKKAYYSAENTKNDFDDYDCTIKSSSMENINIKNLRSKKPKNPKKMTKQKSDEFYNRQEEWYKNKKAKEQYFEQLYQIQNSSFSDITFHPYVNQATLEILDYKNRINTNNDEYKYNIPYNNDKYGESYLNNSRTIYDKLYEDRFKKCYNNPEDFYKSINYDDSYNYIVYQMRKKNKNKYHRKKFNKNCSYCYQRSLFNKNLSRKKNLRINRSFDDINSYKNVNNINDITSRNLRKLKANKNKVKSEGEKYKKNEEFNNYMWKNSLLSIKSVQGKPNDYTYHLNVRQKGAWDNNYLNKIVLDKNANTRAIINSIMSN